MSKANSYSSNALIIDFGQVTNTSSNVSIVDFDQKSDVALVSRYDYQFEQS